PWSGRLAGAAGPLAGGLLRGGRLRHAQDVVLVVRLVGVRGTLVGLCVVCSLGVGKHLAGGAGVGLVVALVGALLQQAGVHRGALRHAVTGGQELARGQQHRPHEILPDISHAFLLTVARRAAPSGAARYSRRYVLSIPGDTVPRSGPSVSRIGEHLGHHGGVGVDQGGQDRRVGVDPLGGRVVGGVGAHDEARHVAGQAVAGVVRLGGDAPHGGTRARGREDDAVLRQHPLHHALAGGRVHVGHLVIENGEGGEAVGLQNLVDRRTGDHGGRLRAQVGAQPGAAHQGGHHAGAGDDLLRLAAVLGDVGITQVLQVLDGVGALRVPHGAQGGGEVGAALEVHVLHQALLADGQLAV